ncbi:unnamed protein product [Cochlearia groenlandica]
MAQDESDTQDVRTTFEAEALNRLAGTVYNWKKSGRTWETRRNLIPWTLRSGSVSWIIGVIRTRPKLRGAARSPA